VGAKEADEEEQPPVDRLVEKSLDQEDEKKE
jgi:hypothetical protein